MVIRIFFFALLLSLPLSAAIAIQPCPPDRKNPIDAWQDAAIAKDYSTAGMRNAANTAREMWDKEMNASFHRLMKKLSPSQRQALIMSQRNWLAFRDSEGDVISKVVAAQNGTMYQLMATGDGMELVKARALQLREYETTIEAP